MRNDNAYSYLSMAVMVLMLSGCATAGAGSSGVSVQSTVEQTHRMVQTIEKDMTTLSHSNADMTARMDATEQQMRTLITLSEDNQRSIAQLQSSIDELIRVSFQRQGLTPPSGAVVTPPTFTPDGTRVTVPATTGAVVTAPSTVPGQSQTGLPIVTSNTGETVDIAKHYEAAQEFYRKGEFSAALRQFDEHLIKYPRSAHTANATYWRAHCYFKMEDYPNAVKGYEELRTKYTSSVKVPFSIYNEAVAYTRLQQPDKAKALFQQLIREYPDDAASEKARAGLRQLQGLGQ